VKHGGSGNHHMICMSSSPSNALKNKYTECKRNILLITEELQYVESKPSTKWNELSEFAKNENNADNKPSTELCEMYVILHKILWKRNNNICRSFSRRKGWLTVSKKMLETLQRDSVISEIDHMV
jgi:hypothetical protein